jgi:outer membrane protein
MASLAPRLLLAAAAAACIASPASLAAQEPDSVPLSFADAIRRVTSREAPPAVQIAGFRTDAAGARVREARAGLLPSLSLSGSWANRNFNSKAQGISFPGVPTVIGPFNAYDGRVQVRQTLFDFANIGRVNAAKSQASAAGAERTAAVETSAQNVALAYARAVRARATVAARRADSTLATELLTLARAQRQAGVSASIDVTRSRAQLTEATGQLIVAQNRYQRAMIDLARALGLDGTTPLVLTDSLSDQLGAADVPADRNAAVARAQTVRPDLAAEAARGAAARTSVSAISAERLPRLELAADYGLSGVRLPDAVGTRQLAVQVTLPILDGFRREGRIAEQEAVVRESDVRERDLRRQIAADVDAALLDLRSAAALEMVAAERLQLASEEVSQARQRFEAGVVGNIEVINAQSALVRARDVEIEARFAAVTARIALARSVGSAHTLH